MLTFCRLLNDITIISTGGCARYGLHMGCPARPSPHTVRQSLKAWRLPTCSTAGKTDAVWCRLVCVSTFKLSCRSTCAAWQQSCRPSLTAAGSRPQLGASLCLTTYDVCAPPGQMLPACATAMQAARLLVFGTGYVLARSSCSPTGHPVQIGSGLAVLPYQQQQQEAAWGCVHV